MRGTALLSGIAILIGISVWLFIGNDGDAGGATSPSSPETASSTSPRVLDAAPIRSQPFREHQRGRGFHAAPLGTRLVFELRQSARVLFGTEKVQEAGTLLQGRVAVTIVNRTETEICVAWDTSDLSATFSPTPPDAEKQVAALKALLHLPWQMKMALDGNTLDAAFHPTVKGNARDMLISLLAETRCVIAPDAPLQWDTVEDDPTGRYRQHYEREDANAAGRIIIKRSLNGDSEPLVPNQPSHHVESGAVIEVDVPLGWVRSIASWRRSHVEIPDINTTARATGEVAWKLLTTETISKDALSALLMLKPDWGGLQRDAATGGEDAERTLRSLWENRLKDVHVRQLIQALEDLLANGQENSEAFFLAMERLSWKLKLDPAALQAEYSSLLRQASPAMQEVLLMVLGQCANAEAVQLLTAVVGDSNYSEASRMAALRSLFQLTQPSGPALASVIALASDPAGSLELRMASMLALGHMANLPGASPAALEQLIALGATSSDPSFTLAWIEAIGNAHPPTPPAHLIELANSADLTVREAAVTALRTCTEPGVVAVMVNLLLQDGNPGIRSIAGEFLATQPGTTHIATLSQVLQNEPSRTVRERVLSALSGQLASPGHTGPARPLIEWSSLHDPLPQVRAYATSLLQ